MYTDSELLNFFRKVINISPRNVSNANRSTLNPSLDKLQRDLAYAEERLLIADKLYSKLSLMQSERRMGYDREFPSFRNLGLSKILEQFEAMPDEEKVEFDNKYPPVERNAIENARARRNLILCEMKDINRQINDVIKIIEAKKDPSLDVKENSSTKGRSM